MGVLAWRRERVRERILGVVLELLVAVVVAVVEVGALWLGVLGDWTREERERRWVARWYFIRAKMGSGRIWSETAG